MGSAGLPLRAGERPARTLHACPRDGGTGWRRRCGGQRRHEGRRHAPGRPRRNLSGHGAKINAQTGTTYTLTASDNGKVVTLDNAAAITLTLPETSTETIAQGFQCVLIAKGAGQVARHRPQMLMAMPARLAVPIRLVAVGAVVLRRVAASERQEPQALHSVVAPAVEVAPSPALVMWRQQPGARTAMPVETAPAHPPATLVVVAEVAPGTPEAQAALLTAVVRWVQPEPRGRADRSG